MFKTIGRIINWCGEFKGKLFMGFFLSFLTSLCTALPVIVAVYTFNMIFEQEKGGTKFDTLWILYSTGLLILLVALRFLFDYLRARCQEGISYELVARDRLAIGNALKRVSLGYFETMDTGNILSAVTTGLHSLENMGIRMLDTFIGGYLNYLCFFLWLLSIDIKVAVITLFGVILSLIFLLIVSRYSLNNAPLAVKAEKDLTNATIEYVRGLSVVKSFGQAGASYDAFRNACSDNRKVRIRIEWGFIPSNCMHLIVLRIASIGIAAAGFYLYYQDKIPFMSMLMLALLSFIAMAGLEPMSDSAHVLSIIDNTFDKIDMMKETCYIDKDGKEILLNNHDIVFEHVDFGYDSRNILHDISFTIPEKTSTAIVGPSGSGKTTICNLIARFYDVNGGKITMGGHNLKEFTCDSLLSNISMVFQNVYLFQDTIANNICFGKPDATKEEMIEAAKKARCHDFIMSFPDGYNTVVGEGGDTLSGGEKQRISIARAILKDAPVIILDEATASVDPENEYLIQEAITQLTKNKTVITIAHRLATIEHADQILVINDGKVVEKGTHYTLVKHGGIYQKFIKIRQEAEGWKIS